MKGGNNSGKIQKVTVAQNGGDHPTWRRSWLSRLYSLTSYPHGMGITETTLGGVA